LQLSVDNRGASGEGFSVVSNEDQRFMGIAAYLPFELMDIAMMYATLCRSQDYAEVDN